MSVIRRIKAASYSTYFSIAFSLGFKNHVYALSNKWGGTDESATLARGDAAWYATQQLYRHYGYRKCASCEWAVKEPNEHMVRGSWCWEQQELLHRDPHEDDYGIGPYVPPTTEQVLAQQQRLDERCTMVTLGLDRELRMNLERCPYGCDETLDCSELEMHELMGCEAAKAMYA
jgi:hypothetical protein